MSDAIARAMGRFADEAAVGLVGILSRIGQLVGLVAEPLAKRLTPYIRVSRMQTRISVITDCECILTGRDRVRALHRVADDFEAYPECAEGVAWCRSHRLSDWRF